MKNKIIKIFTLLLSVSILIGSILFFLYMLDNSAKFWIVLIPLSAIGYVITLSFVLFYIIKGKDKFETLYMSILEAIFPPKIK